VNWQAIDKLKGPVLVKAKIRYKFEEEKAEISPLMRKGQGLSFKTTAGDNSRTGGGFL